MEINTENVNAEAIIEELIEGVIEEKWEKFNKKIKEQEQNLENIAATIKQFEQKISAIKTDAIPKDIELRSDVINNRIDDLDARIGGLEKAFKQFLPSLTRNIENLSNIIHEMKQNNEIPYTHHEKMLHKA
jgi:septal ring factor EnvC (AmiA/AmiB activator)